MRKPFGSFPGSYIFFKEEPEHNGIEIVPLGFAEWVKDNSFSYSLDFYISELLTENNPFEAVEIYEITGSNFNAWMKVIKDRNLLLFLEMERLIRLEEVDRWVELYRKYTFENISGVYH